MATSTELGNTRVVVGTGVVTATVLDTIGADRMYLHLVTGSAGALYAGVEDTASAVPRAVKDIIMFPYTEP